MKKTFTPLIVIVEILVLLFSFIPPAFAATSTPAASNTPSAGQALEIAPPLISLTANPGQTIKTKIMLRDVSKSKLLVTNEIDDFVAAGEDGTPKILMGNDDNNPFTLKNWIMPVANLNLSSQQIQNVPITINVPANASPGGHYGVIRFTGTATDMSTTGVSLTASLGALVLLTVNGQLKHQLSVANFSVNKDGHTGSLFQSAPLNFAVLLHNTGNVQELPIGVIKVSDMFGKAVASVVINSPPRNVLPGSNRKFQSPLDSTNMGNRHLFGHYTAVLSVTYGPNKQVTTAKLSFWIIPYRLLGTIVAIIIVGFFALRYLLRFYNRRIIAKATNATRKNKK